MFGREPYARAPYAGTSTTAGTATVTGDAAFSATATLAATSLLIAVAASSLTGSGTLATSALQLAVASASLDASGTLNATSGETAAADLSATSDFSATASIIYAGTASLSGSSELTASSFLEAVAAADLSAEGTLTATAPDTLLGAADLTASSDLAATSILVVAGASSLSGSGTLTADSVRVVLGASSLSSEGTLAADSIRVVVAAAALSGSGTLTATSSMTAVAASNLSASGTLVGTGALLWSGAASLAGTGTLAATGVNIVTGLGLAFFSASTDLVATGAIPLHAGFATLAGGSNLVALTTAIYVGAASLTSSGTLVTAGAHPVDGASSLSGSGTLASTANLARYPAAVALDAPVLWWDLADSGGFAYSKGSELYFGTLLTATYNAGARVASVMPTEVTTAFDTNTTGYLSGFFPTFDSTPLTFEIWWKPQSMTTGSTRYMVDGSTYFLHVGASGKPKGRLRWQVGATVIETTTTDDLVDDGVYHVVATYHNTTGALQLWVNTKLVATGTAAANAMSAFQSVLIGRFSNVSLDGPAQQFALYKSILSRSQIEAHYGAGTGVFIDRPALSSRGDLVAAGYAFTAGATVGEAALSASSDLTASGSSLAVWVAQTFSSTSSLSASATVIPQAIPDNDEIAGATVLTGTEGSITFATRGATATRGPGLYSDPDVFFVWTAPVSGPVQFRLGPRGDSSYPPYPWFSDCDMEVYEGYPPDPTNYANFDPDVTDPRPLWGDYDVWGSSGAGEVYWPAIEGHTYTIVVVDYQNYPDVPTQTEASLVWTMEFQPISTPSGFGDADFLVVGAYADVTGSPTNSGGLLCKIIRRSEDVFSVMATLAIDADDVVPAGAGEDLGGQGLGGLNSVQRIGDSSALLIAERVWNFPSSHYGVGACVVTWDGTDLTRGPVTVLLDDRTGSTLGVGQWDVTIFAKGGVTGDGAFYVAPQVYSLENGKTYATHKYRMASYAINADGTLTSTGKAVEYVTGYDFSDPLRNDLLAPAIWADDSLQWFPLGFSTDSRYQTTGAREILETSFTRDHIAVAEPAAYWTWAKLTIADDGTITREPDYYRYYDPSGPAWYPTMTHVLPELRKIVISGERFLNDGLEPDIGGLFLVDLDSMNAGPIMDYTQEMMSDYAEEGGNDNYFLRIGDTGSGYAFCFLKQRAGSRYQAQIALQPIDISGTTASLAGDVRILRTIAWSDDMGSNLDEGTQVCIANNTVLFGSIEGDQVSNRAWDLSGQAVEHDAGEGYQLIIPGLDYDTETSAFAMYTQNDIIPFSAAPIPNLAGSLTIQRRQFARGKVGL